jgi:hypothetical protein
MADLCTLDDVKGWLVIPASTTAEDALLRRLISAVSSDFLRAIKRPDLTPAASYTEQRFGNGKTEIFTYHWPINSITSVTIDDVAISASADGLADGYWLPTEPDLEQKTKINLTGFCFTRHGRDFLRSVLNSSSKPNVVLVYNAGYAAVPSDIAQAVIDWVAYRYKGRQWIGQSSKHMNAGENVSFQNALMPETTKAVIEKYEAPLFRDRQ